MHPQPAIVGRLTTMAYVVRRHGRYEVRESHLTERGPRSRTLATFRVLDRAVAEHAAARSDSGLLPDDVVRIARRAGAPVARPVADGFAANLIGELEGGTTLAEPLRRVLVDRLGPAPAPTDAERAAAAWIGASDVERGAALRDLLLLTDALPAPRRARDSRFPGFIAER